MADDLQVVVQINRAVGSPSVQFGPFAGVEDAIDWLKERSLSGSLLLMYAPAADTSIFSQVWC